MLVWRGLKPSRTMLALRALLEPEQIAMQPQDAAPAEPGSPRPVSSLRFPTQG